MVVFSLSVNFFMLKKRTNFRIILRGAKWLYFLVAPISSYILKFYPKNTLKFFLIQTLTAYFCVLTSIENNPQNDNQQRSSLENCLSAFDAPIRSFFLPRQIR